MGGQLKLQNVYVVGDGGGSIGLLICTCDFSSESVKSCIADGRLPSCGGKALSGNVEGEVPLALLLNILEPLELLAVTRVKDEYKKVLQDSESFPVCETSTLQPRRSMRPSISP